MTGYGFARTTVSPKRSAPSTGRTFTRGSTRPAGRSAIAVGVLWMAATMSVVAVQADGSATVMPPRSSPESPHGMSSFPAAARVWTYTSVVVASRFDMPETTARRNDDGIAAPVRDGAVVEAG